MAINETLGEAGSGLGRLMTGVTDPLVFFLIDIAVVVLVGVILFGIAKSLFSMRNGTK